MGADRIATARSEAYQVRLVVCDRRGLSGHWRDGGDDRAAHQRWNHQYIFATDERTDRCGCARGDDLGSGGLPSRCGVAGSIEHNDLAVAAVLARVESD